MKPAIWAILLCFAFFLPLGLISAQEEVEAEAAAPVPAPVEAPVEAPAAAPARAPASQDKGQFDQVQNMATSWINKLIGYISKIGGIFGDAAGVRIGGTSITGIAALGGAKLLEDKLPSWIKWILYLTGGTMFAGGGANIAQIIMQLLG